jgi:hypothetical protein
MGKTQRNTPLRRAVDFLIENGDIQNDKDLLPLFKVKSPGALSAYISGNPSKKGLKAFRDKYGEKVSKFFEHQDPIHSTMAAESGFFYISPREHIETIKQHNKDLKEIILEQLKAMSSQLREISFNSNEILAGVQRQAVYGDARSDVALEALARLEKKKPDVLKEVVNKRARVKMGNKTEHGISDGVGK